MCTVSGSTVTIAATGTCTIAADQAGNANYNAAPQFPQSFTVGQGTQTIAGFAPATPIAYAPGGTFALTATGGASGNAVTFASTTPAICTVSGATATIVAVGSCTLTANQTGNANYAAAAQVTAGVAINKANQTIAFGALATRTVGDAPFALSATASSGLTVTFSSTTGTVCTVSGATATLLTAGACTIAADQAGNANYNAAPQVSQSFTVNAPPIQVFYVHPDHLGTPRAITRASDNAKVWEWRNDDPFGNNPVNEDPDSTGTSFRYNLRFGGMTYFDAETGTLQNTHRDLDLLSGRYIQSDPIGLGGGINTYAYVAGNPLSLVDNFGLMGQGAGGLNGPGYPGKVGVPGVNKPDAFTALWNAWYEFGRNVDKKMQDLKPTGGDKICGECAPGDMNCLLYGGNQCNPGYVPPSGLCCDQSKLTECEVKVASSFLKPKYGGVSTMMSLTNLLSDQCAKRFCKPCDQVTCDTKTDAKSSLPSWLGTK